MILLYLYPDQMASLACASAVISFFSQWRLRLCASEKCVHRNNNITPYSVTEYTTIALNASVLIRLILQPSVHYPFYPQHVYSK